MTQIKVVPPPFLQRKLSDPELSQARDNLPAFLEKVKKDNNGEYPPTKEILLQYVVYLGKKHKKWKGIRQETLSTRWAGVYHVYDMIRKRTKILDEKKLTPQPAPAKANGKPTPSKDVKAEDQDQIKDKEPVTKVEAEDYHTPGLEEKKVKYYRHLDNKSISSISD